MRFEPWARRNSCIIRRMARAARMYLRRPDRDPRCRVGAEGRISNQPSANGRKRGITHPQTAVSTPRHRSLARPARPGHVRALPDCDDSRVTSAPRTACHTHCLPACLPAACLAAIHAPFCTDYTQSTHVSSLVCLTHVHTVYTHERQSAKCMHLATMISSSIRKIQPSIEARATPPTAPPRCLRRTESHRSRGAAAAVRRHSPRCSSPPPPALARGRPPSTAAGTAPASKRSLGGAPRPHDSTGCARPEPAL